jgi:hypothetical protein
MKYGKIFIQNFAKIRDIFFDKLLILIILKSLTRHKIIKKNIRIIKVIIKKYLEVLNCNNKKKIRATPESRTKFLSGSILKLVITQLFFKI